MMEISRLKNQMLARISSYIPSLSRHFINSYTPMTSVDIPWTPVKKPLSESKIAVVTTAGVHHKDQIPFNMNDREGDPSFRVIDSRRPINDLMITHDYYDHGDADKDINIVFPIERLREFESEGHIANVADTHYGFMGHIDGSYINVLINRYAPEAARRLKEDNIDCVLLLPG